MENLFDQMATISKAQGFDILSKQVGELKKVIRDLINVGELEDIEFTEPAATLYFQSIVKKAKILSL